MLAFLHGMADFLGACSGQPVHQQPQRAASDVPVEKYAYVRVHVHPKRFPSAYKVDWKVGSERPLCIEAPAEHAFTVPMLAVLPIAALFTVW